MVDGGPVIRLSSTVYNAKELAMDDNTSDKDSRPLFQGIDEFERTYAPQELAEDDPARQRVNLDEGMSFTEPTDLEPTSAEPVASVGSSPSGDMATPGLANQAQVAAADNIEDQGPLPGIDDVPDDEG